MHDTLLIHCCSLFEMPDLIIDQMDLIHWWHLLIKESLNHNTLKVKMLHYNKRNRIFIFSHLV